MNWTDLFGYAGTVTSITFMIPQIVKSLISRHTADLSWAMLCLLLLNCVFWFAYGLGTHSRPLLITNSFCFIIIALQACIKGVLEDL